MPLIRPVITLPPPPVHPPGRQDAVPAVEPVSDQRPRRDGSGDRRRKRRALLDLLMKEVEAIPDLPPPDKQRIRANLRDFVRRETIRPPRRETPTVGAGDVQAAAVPPPDHDHIVRAALPQPTAEAQQQIEEAARLEAEFRRVLALHTEPARKIATYIHALQILEDAPHLVTFET